jgi:hypothetical protein
MGIVARVKYKFNSLEPPREISIKYSNLKLGKAIAIRIRAGVIVQINSIMVNSPLNNRERESDYIIIKWVFNASGIVSRVYLHLLIIHNYILFDSVIEWNKLNFPA